MHIRIAIISELLAFISTGACVISLLIGNHTSSKVSFMLTGLFIIIIVVCGIVDIIKSIKEDKKCKN